MRKILFATLLALIVSVQSFCSAATIESACFNGDEKLVYPVVQTGNEAIDQKINAKIKEELMGFATLLDENTPASLGDEINRR